MKEDPTLVYTPANVREIDRIAIEEVGMPGYTLMRRAGEAMFADVRERYPDARQWLIVCGAGNNAGDGYVVAGLARDAYLDVTVATLTDPATLTGDAARAWQEFDRNHGETVPFDTAQCEEPEVDLIIDAMLGTGLVRALSGAYLEAVTAINAAPVPVVAVDIPTGLNGTDGTCMGGCVCADMTVTFVGLKQGMYAGDGPANCGDIRLHRLGIPAGRIGQVQASARVFGAQELARFLPERRADVHKGQLGHALIIGGNLGMAGAVRLAGEAALRSGAGRVTVACRPENVASTVTYRPELMCHGIEDSRALESLLERASVIAIGPGLGQDAWARDIFGSAMAAERVRIVDADALNLLAAEPRDDPGWILTPHPGEAARLLGESSARVQAQRLVAVEKLAKRYGGVCVLKGHGTLVGRAGELPYLITAGNPAMATAGMGDVLTGVTAGLVAQNSADLLTAAAAAAFVHACAGDLAAKGDTRGVIASDLFAFLRPCLQPAH